jgi:hypothetical protein
MSRLLYCVATLGLVLGFAKPAHATILTFEVFDPDPFFLNGNFNNQAVDPHLDPSYGYPEGFRLDGYFNTAASGLYGSRVGSTDVTADNGVRFLYGIGAEGFTPNVRAYYGPYSIFTGGPTLWREGYSDLDGVLYQGSALGNPPIGTDYNILDVVLVADAGFDVQLFGFDLGSFGADRTVGAVEVFDGVPFPLLTPTNYLFGPETNVDVLASMSTHIDFGGTLLQSPVIWLRINANNLGADSENIAIDNIRFGQIASNNPGTLDPADIDAAFVSTEAVPEPASAVLCLVGGVFAGIGFRRRKSSQRPGPVDVP